MARSKAKPLFDDDDDDRANGEAFKNGRADPEISSLRTDSLRVNQEYAKRFTHNKKREALHRLQELKKSGRVVDSSDDDDDDEDDESSDDGLLPARTEVRILDTLAKIRMKDPSIYAEDSKFFDDDEEDDDEEKYSVETVEKEKLEDQAIQRSDSPMFPDDEEIKKLKKQERKKKPMYLKDVIAKQLMEDESDVDENGREENGKSKKMKNKKDVVTYAEEQKELKNEFLRSVKIDEEDKVGGNDKNFLKLRKKDTLEVGENMSQSVDDSEIAHRLEEYFGGDDKLDENEKFLKEYLLKKSWIDEDEGKIPSYDEIVGHIIDDEEELEKQEKFEADYNFRFEEGTGSQVMGHSRIIDDSVRRKDDTRRQKRLKKKERLSEVDLERREELKRLKNIKKREILEKLERIKNVAGAKDSDKMLLETLGEDDLEEEFDPDEYDKKMKEAFGEEYYGAEDADENFEGYEVIEKPDFDAEDEILGLAKGRDEFGVGSKDAGFAAARKKANETKLIGSERDSNEGEDDDEEEKEMEEEDDEEEYELEEDDEEENELEEDDEEENEMDEEDDVNGNQDEDEDDVVISKDLVYSEEGGTGKSADSSKRKKKSKISLREKLAFDKELEEYYKLDYEDMVGDLPTRFKYRQVKPSMYGLTTAEILAADDEDLNQYVSLRKIAPYTTEEWKPKWRFQVSQKLRKKKALKRQSAVEGDPSANRIGNISRISRKKMATQSFAEEDSSDFKYNNQKSLETKNSENEYIVNGDDSCNGLHDAGLKSTKKKKEKDLEKGAIQSKDDPSLATVSLPSPKVDDHQGEKESKNKRRRRKKGLSLPESRLIAYGKITLPSLKKRKRV